MKSQIPGMCAELNEKIDVLEVEKEDLDYQVAALEDKQDALRTKLNRLRTTVSTLQELKDGEL